MKHRNFYIGSAAVILAVVIFFFSVEKSYTQSILPKREMRAVWIATFKGIDFPRKRKMSVVAMKKDLTEMLNMHSKNGINAVVFQVRAAADAFYKSNYEPWSQWLAGQQGQPTDPYFDPLEFLTRESHSRGMEFHAWFNPYRALADTGRTVPDSLHITQTKPEWFIAYGRNLYFDPGIPEVRDYIIQVILDVVRRYDIDAVHFDDYFYPYKIKDEEFPDTVSFKKYGADFNEEDIGDWRRENISQLISRLNDSIKATKSYVKFGVAPFGVWRNKSKDPRGSATRGGAPSYDVLYADVLKWLENGWIDYVAPQIYWHIGFKIADYKILLEWWSKNSYGKQVYIGNAAYKIDKESKYKAWQNPDELPNQIAMARMNSKIHGNMFFSSKVFKKNHNGISDRLEKEIYRTPALIPTMNWIDNKPPETPVNLKRKKKKAGYVLSWETRENASISEMDKASYFVIYKFKGRKIGDINNPNNIVAIVRDREYFIKSEWAFFRKRYTFAVSAVDRNHNESVVCKPVIIKLNN